LTDNDEKPLLIICAVPFLRERDISKYIENETYSERSKRIAECIKKHYKTVAEIAKSRQNELGLNIPIIAMGHLSVTGGKTIADDGVRETYIGNIECIDSDIFPSDLDYVALGHYHIPSRINNNVRYCGSPLPMGFGEANQQKNVIVIEFENGNKTINEITIPVFQKLESIVGDKDFIFNKLLQLRANGESVWVEIVYDGNELFADFSAWVAEQVENTEIEVLKIQNKQYFDKELTHADTVKSLDELSEYDVFDKLLKGKDFPEEQKSELKDLYREIISEMNKNDD
jgi:exonuclease SbcD